ncbi:MAG TPA: hypothetical protein VLE97_05920 [Gaiellaceae bacterium]|nr:hypothetical protein [Gaiellaceae bacterium]
MSGADDRTRRDQRVEAFTAIGCSIAALKRIDYIWCDDEVRDALTRARAILSAAQSTIKERIDGSATQKESQP